MKLFFYNRVLVRNLYAQTLLENFLISAVSTILLIRFYLELTGYPQIGGSHLHIAHMLFGGILMMITIFILFSFLNRLAFNIASITGGVGFGFFIDELGKFITKNNDYFFEPTVALIYVIFVVMYLAGEIIPKHREVSKTEFLVNAWELSKEALIHDLDSHEKKEALAYLRASDQSDPLVADLRELLSGSRSKPNHPDLYTRMKTLAFEKVETITQNKWFFYFVIFFIVIQAILSLLITFFIIAAVNSTLFLVAAGMLSVLTIYLQRKSDFLVRFLTVIAIGVVLYIIHYMTLDDVYVNLSFIGWGTLISTALGAMIAFIGLMELGKSRLQALKLFRISILVSIFLTQFFLFYSLQFYALIGLAINILMLLTIEFVIAKKLTEEDIVEKNA